MYTHTHMYTCMYEPAAAAGSQDKNMARVRYGIAATYIHTHTHTNMYTHVYMYI